jgi:hypothetical protein
MAADPHTIRFTVGKTYRLYTSPELPQFLGGNFTVIAELSPSNQWGNRILLVDAHLDNSTDLLGCRCFVEEGFSESVGVYGSRTIPVEIATLQGTYPSFAKAHANADIPAVQSGFTVVKANRVA